MRGRGAVAVRRRTLPATLLADPWTLARLHLSLGMAARAFLSFLVYERPLSDPGILPPCFCNGNPPGFAASYAWPNFGYPSQPATQTEGVLEICRIPEKLRVPPPSRFGITCLQYETQATHGYCISR